MSRTLPAGTSSFFFQFELSDSIAIVLLHCMIAAAIAVGVAAAAKQPPNIMMLFPDQWRYEWHSLDVPGRLPGGKAAVRTPTLAALAARGTLFERAYVPTPLCAPSRAALALGREYDEQMVPSNSFDVPTALPTVYSSLRDGAGYHVMITGKDDLTKHSGYGPDGSYRAAELGFSAWLGRTAGKAGTYKAGRGQGPYPAFLANQTVTLSNGSTVNALWAHDACNSFSAFSPANKSWLTCCEGGEEGICGKPSPLPDSMYEDNFVTAQGLQMFSEKPAGKPWFLMVNWPGPHGPFVVTASMMARVAGRPMLQPHDYFRGKDNASQLEMSRRVYTAEVENLDAAMGQFITAARALGEVEFNNTLICIASDHGELLGDHGDWGKSKPWEGASHVPLVCAGAGVAAHARVAAPVTTMDMAATWLDYAGLGGAARSLPNATSRTLRPLLEGAAHRNRDFVLSGLGRNASGAGDTAFNWRMVVQRQGNRTLKYVCCEGYCPGAPSNVARAVAPTQWQDLLYDTDADPAEMTNLRETEPASTIEGLRRLLPPQFAAGCKGASPAPVPTPAPSGAAFWLRHGSSGACLGGTTAFHGVVALAACGATGTSWVTSVGGSGTLRLAANSSLELSLKNGASPDCAPGSVVNLGPAVAAEVLLGNNGNPVWNASAGQLQVPAAKCEGAAEPRCVASEGDGKPVSLDACSAAAAKGFLAVPAEC